MAKAFVKTFKRDYVRMHELPDAVTVMKQLPHWFEGYNEYHPHKGLQMMSPREFKNLSRGYIGVLFLWGGQLQILGKISLALIYLHNFCN
jgi:transposase InsO family protein